MSGVRVPHGTPSSAISADLQMIIAYAGNRTDKPTVAVGESRFPAANITSVRERISTLLVALRPTTLVGALAAGADLLIAQVALDLGLPLRVLLPLELDPYRAASVSDRGSIWGEIL